MSAFLVPEIWCDGCSLRFGPGAEGSGDATSIPAARAEAKDQHDWAYRHLGTRLGYVDLCPNCDRKHRQPSQPPPPPADVPTLYGVPVSQIIARNEAIARRIRPTAGEGS